MARAGASAAEARCETRSAGAASQAGVSWRDVVFGMAVHDSAEESALLQAAADTWLHMARGADLVLMTDVDDARSVTAIAPRVSGGVQVHVYRCADCRGQRCANAADGRSNRDGCSGVREGWLARRKVLHLFVAMARRFGAAPNISRGSGNSGGGRASADGSAAADGVGMGMAAPKRFFVKVDPDTVPLPHNIMRLLAELSVTLGDAQPYLFGMAACRVASFPLCHAAGGAGYGLSRAALTELTSYVHGSYPSFLSRVDKFTYGGEDVAVAFALKKQAGVAVLNVGCLYQHSPLKYRKLHAKGEDWVKWPLTRTPASFHKFKDAEEQRAFFACALYDDHAKPRPAPRSLFAALNSTCVDGWRHTTAVAAHSPPPLQDGGITRLVSAPPGPRIAASWPGGAE